MSISGILLSVALVLSVSASVGLLWSLLRARSALLEERAQSAQSREQVSRLGAESTQLGTTLHAAQASLRALQSESASRIYGLKVQVQQARDAYNAL